MMCWGTARRPSAELRHKVGGYSHGRWGWGVGILFPVRWEALWRAETWVLEHIVTAGMGVWNGEWEPVPWRGPVRSCCTGR